MEAAKEWGMPPWRVERDCPRYWWERWLVKIRGGAPAETGISDLPPELRDDPYAQAYQEAYALGVLPEGEYGASNPNVLSELLALTA